MKLLPIALVAAAATVLGLVWVASRPPVDAEPAAPAAKPAVTAARPAPGASAPRPAPQATANPLAAVKAMPVRATLFNEFLGTKDYRSIYDRLNGSPEGATAEGRLVLYEILRQCATVTEGRRYTWKPPTPKREEFLASIALTDPNRDKRIAAYENFTANRCAGFEGVSLTQAELDRLLAESAAAGDPRAKAMSIEQELWQLRRNQGRNSATITDDQVATLQQIASTKDPEAIRVAGRVLSNSWADYSLRIGPNQQPVEPRAFMNAWLVLACEFGQPCGTETTRMQQACAMQGHCDAQTYPDYLWYYSSSPHDSQLLVQYRAYLRQAIETGDWSQLSVARGVPQLPNRVTFVPGPR